MGEGMSMSACGTKLTHLLEGQERDYMLDNLSRKAEEGGTWGRFGGDVNCSFCNIFQLHFVSQSPRTRFTKKVLLPKDYI